MIIQNAKRIIENVGADNEKITYIQSIHAHDYNSYQLANGHRVVVDGGKDYFRGSIDTDLPPGVVVDNWSLIEGETYNQSELFNILLWGTYGKDGNQPLSYKLIKDCDIDHLKAILKHVPAGSIHPLHEKVIRHWIKEKSN